MAESKDSRPCLTGSVMMFKSQPCCAACQEQIHVVVDKNMFDNKNTFVENYTESLYQIQFTAMAYGKVCVEYRGFSEDELKIMTKGIKDKHEKNS